MEHSDYYISFNKEAAIRSKRIAESVVKEWEGKFLICPKCDGTSFIEDHKYLCKYCDAKGYVDWIQSIMLRELRKYRTT